ncbi:hypothetical protein F5Y17DRAFT_216887 [Xylariaceae sp. FL0594]|nr:hypothetical protein F5Y17DRAFT_216887 [Xylariaceae sp. FL0594]
MHYPSLSAKPVRSALLAWRVSFVISLLAVPAPLLWCNALAHQSVSLLTRDITHCSKCRSSGYYPRTLFWQSGRCSASEHACLMSHLNFTYIHYLSHRYSLQDKTRVALWQTQACGLIGISVLLLKFKARCEGWQCLCWKGSLAGC